MQRLSFFTGLVLLLITGMASVLVTPMTADAQIPDPTIEWVKFYTNPTSGAKRVSFRRNGLNRTGYEFPMDSNGELNGPGVTEVTYEDAVIGGTQIGIAIRLTNVTYANGQYKLDIGGVEQNIWGFRSGNPLHDEFIFPGNAGDSNDTGNAVELREYYTLVGLCTLPTTRNGQIVPKFYDDESRYPDSRWTFIWGSGGSGGGNKYSSVATRWGYFKDATGAVLPGPYPQARSVDPVMGVSLVDAAGTALTKAPRSGKSRLIQSVAAATTDGYSTLRLDDIAADNCAYYGAGDDVNFKVRFQQAMSASGTDKSLRLEAHWGNPSGVDSPKALIADGDGTQDFTFRYTVAQGDNSIGTPLSVSHRFHKNDNRNDNPALKIRSVATGALAIDKFLSWSRINRELNDFYGLPPDASILHPNSRKFLVDGIQPSVRLLGVVTPQTHTIDSGFLKEPIGRNPQFAADPQAALALVRDNPDRESPHLQRGEFHVDLRGYNYGIGEGREAIVASEVELAASDITLEPSSGAAADWDMRVGYIGLDHRRLDGSESDWARWLCYRVVITPPKDFEGSVGISVPAGATQDIAGNPNQASNTLTVTVDTVAPKVIGMTFPDDAPALYTVGDEITFELVFHERIRQLSSGAEKPTVTLMFGQGDAAVERTATWVRIAEALHSRRVKCTYTVVAGDFSDAVRLKAVTDTTGAIKDIVGNLYAGEVALETPSEGGEVFGGIYLPEPTEEPRSPASDVPRSPIVFNELGNGSGDANDWLEFRNVTASAVSLKEWELSVVQDGKQEDTSLIVFPDVSVPAEGLLLITNQPSDKTPLAGGDDIAASDEKKKGLSHLTLVTAGLSLPDDGQFLLILRKAKEKLGLDEAFVDVAGGGGSDTDAFIREQTGLYDTYIWPLQVLEAPSGDTEESLGSGKVWQRAKADIVGYHKDAWAEAAFTGLGYDRKVSASAATAGTPGYPNVPVKTAAATPKGAVTFSEIMVDSGGGTLPQWIELYNTSKTEVLNLNRWELEIQNVDSEDLVGRPIVRLTLQEKVIQPNQTLLIVTGDARASSADVFPEDRVYNLLALHDKNLRIKRAQDTFLSAEGFYLKLTDRNGQLVDEIGNTDGDRRTKDAPAWALPVGGTSGPDAMEGVRSSLIRRYDKGVARAGMEKASWALAANFKQFKAAGLHYGHADDIGTPGYRQGGALPVELSSFTVTRVESGSVMVTWTTESEVDNAGFNLRRSEKRESGFTLLNAALIAGAGTTGERQEYTFTDTSAKPGIEYYYQIEEVAFDGKRETLAMRLLRGPVSAANRALTTFGAVKQAK